MIIPIRCMTCGFILADKWRYYEARVAVLRKEMGLGSEPITIDGTSIPDTPERRVMNELNIHRYCCRKTLLTHRDLLTKI